MIPGRDRRAVAIKAAARRGDDHRLAAGQALGPIFAIGKGLALDGDAVDPGLELAGDPEIVHRRADHHDVGSKNSSRTLSLSERIAFISGLRWLASAPAAKSWSPARWVSGWATRSR